MHECYKCSKMIDLHKEDKNLHLTANCEVWHCPDCQGYMPKTDQASHQAECSHPFSDCHHCRVRILTEYSAVHQAECDEDGCWQCQKVLCRILLDDHVAGCPYRQCGECGKIMSPQKYENSHGARCKLRKCLGCKTFDVNREHR